MFIFTPKDERSFLLQKAVQLDLIELLLIMKIGMLIGDQAMQTVLGSNGQIGHELVKELYANYTQDLRLVSRHPQKINPTDQVVSADLRDLKQTVKAIENSTVVYFAAGLPIDSKRWETDFLPMLQNVIRACELHGSKLVFFDNTYMYPKDSTPQDENIGFAPTGRKSLVRSEMTKLLLSKMQAKTLDAVICRAPEFYGPDRTQSITNRLVLNPIKNHLTAKIPVSADTLRTLIWTPDASRAMALIGNTPDAYGQTWHLPCDQPHTYSAMIKLAEQILKRPVAYRVTPLWQMKLAGLFSQSARELHELLPRYQVDNIFLSNKFKRRFPEFKVTPLEVGLQQMLSSKS